MPTPHQTPVAKNIIFARSVVVSTLNAGESDPPSGPESEPPPADSSDSSTSSSSCSIESESSSDSAISLSIGLSSTDGSLDLFL